MTQDIPAPAKTATKLSSSQACTLWRIDNMRGKTYQATTYPNSTIVYIESSAGRKVHGKNLELAVREAIKRAIMDHAKEAA